jgi:hypothetical protein
LRERLKVRLTGWTKEETLSEPVLPSRNCLLFFLPPSPPSCFGCFEKRERKSGKERGMQVKRKMVVTH